MTKSDLFLMRRNKGITLRQIADYIGCSVSLLSFYERNKRHLNAAMQQKYQEFIEQY